ncbi:MAG: hypothetical protein CVV24_11795 [Ignavibacteriae bacterium HGW-Ignavibacteriae-3]|nr:MAG: hypothetical protein CVV24_11795 [Ignavibacteriae bacterium HGW-Ignavibacteriae-3]
MKFIHVFFISLLLLSHSLNAQSPDSVKTIFNEIVVTATKSETPLYSVGSSISVITSEEISKGQFQTVVDVLREETGLSIIQQGGPGKLANVFIRGANPNHTLVIVDGVKMNDASSPNNAFDFASLNTNDIDRIEIVRGPQSTLYGSDALAGIISIITKQGSSQSQYSLLSEGGSNGYYRGNFSALGKLGMLTYHFSASKVTTDGISASNSKYGNVEKDGFKNNSITSRIGLNLSRETKLDLIYKFSKSETALDQSEKFGDDPDYNYYSEEHLFKAGLNLTTFENKWKQLISASYTKRFSHSVDLTDPSHPNLSSDSYNNAERLKFDWQNNLTLFHNNIITFGIDAEKEIARTSYYSTSDWGTFDSVFPEQSIITTGIYFQDQMNINNSLYATFGLRFDENSKFGGVTTFRIAPAYIINETGTKIKMSYGSGFKAPSLFYLFDPVFGNPELKPETSRGWDLGIEQNFSDGKYNFGITYFDLRLENMFGFDSGYRTVNIAGATSRGIELNARINYPDVITINFNYTNNHTRNEYLLSTDFNRPLLRRPANLANIIANFRMSEKLNLNLQIRYVGERDDKDFSSYEALRLTLPDYMLVNLSGSYKILSFMEVKLRIENLFDKEYEEVLYYGTLGRSIYAGLKFQM